MINLDLVTTQFARAISEAAAEHALTVAQADVQPTFTLVNSVKKEVTVCYRLRVPSREALAAFSQTRLRRRSYRAAQSGPDRSVRVRCFLSGGVLGDQLLDWTGNPVDALG